MYLLVCLYVCLLGCMLGCWVVWLLGCWVVWLFGCLVVCWVFDQSVISDQFVIRVTWQTVVSTDLPHIGGPGHWMCWLWMCWYSGTVECNSGFARLCGSVPAGQSCRVCVCATPAGTHAKQAATAPAAPCPETTIPVSGRQQGTCRATPWLCL